MGQHLDDEAFFQAANPATSNSAIPHKAVRVQLTPQSQQAKHAHAELNPAVAQQAQQVRQILQHLERQTQKMRDALHKLEQLPKPNRRVGDSTGNSAYPFERRRAQRVELNDPNQLFLFDRDLLAPVYPTRPAELPAALDGVSIENFSISLAYGDDGMGIVGSTLVALASSDSNGDGVLDSNDCYPDNSPVQRLNLDLNQLREGMMQKVRELVARFDTNGNGRIDGPNEAFAFLHHIANLDLDVDASHIDAASGMITTESYIKAFGERLNRGLSTPDAQ